MKQFVDKLKTKRHAFLILLIFAFPVLSSAQHHDFRNFSVEDGLGQSQVYCLLQDGRGYLWYGAYGGGIGRYDGRRFENFTTREGLSDNTVHCITEDRNGDLWIGTENGLNKYDGRIFTVYRKEHGLSHNFIRAVTEDNKGRLWIATDGGGVNVFDGTFFIQYSTGDGLPHDSIRCILQDRWGNIWIGSQNGAARFDGKTFTTYSTKDGLPHNTINHIIQDQPGDLWFATDGGVCTYDGAGFSPCAISPGPGDSRTTFISEDFGRLWFAGDYGAGVFDGRNYTRYTTRQGLSYDLVHTVLTDLEGNTWFGTDLGLSRLSDSGFVNISREDGLEDNLVWSIWETPDNVIWLATEKTVGVYDEKKKASPVSLLKNAPPGSAYPFFEDSRGVLWFGGDNRLFKYRDGVFTDVSEKTGMTGKEIFSIYEDNRGVLWFGTRLYGVTRYDGKTAVQFSSRNGMTHDRVSAMVEDEAGNLWFGSNNGIDIYDGDYFTHIDVGDQLPAPFVTCMAKGPDGGVWIGTFGGGVARHPPSPDPKTAEIDTFTVHDGLPDNSALQLVFDDDGNLWIGTYKGVSKLNVWAYKRDGRKLFKNYGKEDGFTGIECNQGAAYKDSKGNLWFGTIKGVFRYNPKADKINRVEPSTYITGLKLFLENLDLGVYAEEHAKQAFLPEGLRLPHHLNHLTFDFIGISFTVPERVRYQYFLEGFDDNWSPESKAVYATYSNLPPGRYTFKVRACNNSGVWNREPATYRFIIRNPFWNTWWFFLLCGLTAIFSVSAFIKIRTRKLQKQQQVLEEKVHQRTLELAEEKEKVERINLELEERVRERTQKLTRTHDQLLQAQKLKVVGTLAAGVAHDLNNILAGIVTYPDLLLLKMPEDNPLRKYIMTIKRTGEKAAAIVQDLLTMARRGVSVRETVDFNLTIKDTLKSPEMEKLRFYHPRVKIKTSLDEALHHLSGSSVHLSKAVMNLVSNAAEAMPDGGRVTLTTRNLHMDPPIKDCENLENGEYVVLSVEDTGIGMTEEEMSHIFEPFYTKKEMGRSGTGLGMTVVWSTVEDHNGCITVRSTKGGGAAFTLYFPAAAGQKAHVEPPGFQLSDLKGNGQAILVVDDVKEQREALTLILEELGYNVTAVTSGEEAVEYIANHPVELVFLDMIMDPASTAWRPINGSSASTPNKKP